MKIFFNAGPGSLLALNLIQSEDYDDDDDTGEKTGAIDFKGN